MMKYIWFSLNVLFGLIDNMLKHYSCQNLTIQSADVTLKIKIKVTKI